MARYIRILPKRHYFRDLKRFSSEAFKNYKGTISVVQGLCISNSGSSVCSHLKQYYVSVDEPPHVFWPFEDKIIPSKCKFVQKDSDSGDKCHYVIENMSDKQAKRLFNQHGNLPNNLKKLKICDNCLPRQLKDSDIKNF